MFRVLLGALTTLGVLALPGLALAGSLTLHPAGIGKKSYAAWKAHQGFPDTRGDDDQTLYFQKGTVGGSEQGVAVFKGVKGLPVEQLTGLEFWVSRPAPPPSGDCFPMSPRFTIIVKTGSTFEDFFIGCQMMVAGATATSPDGRPYQQRTFATPGVVCDELDSCNLVPFPTAGTIEVLAIVFDADEITQGSVRLDDIMIEMTASPPTFKCWTGANDNANTEGACPPPGTTTASVFKPKIVKVQLGDSTPLDGGSTTPDTTLDETLPVGLPVDTTDLELVDALMTLGPNVLITDWLMYPDVVYPTNPL